MHWAVPKMSRANGERENTGYSAGTQGAIKKWQFPQRYGTAPGGVALWTDHTATLGRGVTVTELAQRAVTVTGATCESRCSREGNHAVQWDQQRPPMEPGEDAGRGPAVTYKEQHRVGSQRKPQTPEAEPALNFISNNKAIELEMKSKPEQN